MEKWFKTFKVSGIDVLVTKDLTKDTKEHCVLIEYVLNDSRELRIFRGEDECRRDYFFDVVNKKFCRDVIESDLIGDPEL